jgi:hypothetical protein
MALDVGARRIDTEGTKDVDAEHDLAHLARIPGPSLLVDAHRPYSDRCVDPRSSASRHPGSASSASSIAARSASFAAAATRPAKMASSTSPPSARRILITTARLHCTKGRPAQLGGCCWCGRAVRARHRGRLPVAPRRVAGCPIHTECYREINDDASRRLDLPEGLS